MILVPNCLPVLVLIVSPYELIRVAEVIVVSFRILQMFYDIGDFHTLQLRHREIFQNEGCRLLLQGKQRPLGILLGGFFGLDLFGPGICVLCSFVIGSFAWHRVFGLRGFVGCGVFDCGLFGLRSRC